MLTAISAAPETWLMPLVLRRDLVDQGFNDRAIARLVKSGVWAKPRRGAFVDGPGYAKLDEVGRHAVRSRAVLRQARVPMSLTHTSALVWHNAPSFGLDLREVQTTRHDAKCNRAEAGVRQHSGLLPPEHRTELHGIRLASPTRAAVEFTTVAGVEAGIVQVSHLLHTGQTNSAQLSAMQLYTEHWPNSLTTDLVLRLADERFESVAEARFFYLCFRWSVPMPQPQYVVEDRAGLSVARLDFAWPARKRWVEVDGRVKYEKLLREGERASDVVLREKRREKMVQDITGWECLRIDNDDLSWGRHTAERVRQFLDAG
ncbi:MAG: hypothetical protein CMJ44_11610 [Pimelobacter sp.]|nr:hypothetical protein [Pimelobacter sp.]